MKISRAQVFVKKVPQLVEQINVTILEDKKYNEAWFQISNLLFMLNKHIDELTLFEIFDIHKSISTIRFDIVKKFMFD